MTVMASSYPFRARARTALFLTVATTAMLALPNAARAQMVPVPAPPVEQAVDANGVDVVFGTFNISSVDLSIGPAGSQGMIYARESRGAGWRDNFAATLSSDGTTVMVSIGGTSDSFTQSGNSFTSTQGNGATLVLNGDYIYTSADGTVVRFAPASGDYDRFASNMGWARSIEFADGARWDFTYVDKLYCPQVLAGGQGCTVPQKRSVRLQSVTNSFRYQIKLEYASNTLTQLGELEPWNRVAKVTGINNAVEACAPAADTCNLTNAWPSVTYDASGETVTHSGGTVKRFTKGPNGIVAVKRAGSASNNVTVAYGADGKVSQVVNEGVATSYAWSDFIGVRTLTVTAPLGITRSIHSNLATSLVSSTIVVASPGVNLISTYLYDPQSRLTRVTAPEGNAVEYSYDTRGNIVTTTNVAKPGSGLANIVTSASYPLTCTNPKICNKPVSTTDALGRVTDYTYDPTHGQILSVTEPAATVGGVRPQTRYSYSVLGGVALVTTVSQCLTLASCAATADEIKTVITFAPAGSNMLPVSSVTSDGFGNHASAIGVAYDAIGNVISVDGPLPGSADTLTSRYDTLRRATGVVSADPDGSGPLKRRAQRISYNDDDQVTRSEFGTVNGLSDSDWASFTSVQQSDNIYDLGARLVRQVDMAAWSPVGVTQYSYDALGRLDCAAQRLNPAVWVALPPSACTLQSNGPAGYDRISKLTYDLAGRVTQQQSALGTPEVSTILASYTFNGQQESLTDGKGNKTGYEYDGFDRLTKTRFPSPSTTGVSSATDFEQLSYDLVGNVTQRRLRDGQLITLGYDRLDRLIRKDVPNTAFYEFDISYQYDLLGRLKLIQDDPGHYAALTYDALGRQLSETGSFSTRFFTYDAAGRRTSLSYGDGFSTTYDYLVTGEVSAIRENGAAVLASFGYDDLGRRTSLTRGNGTVTSYAFDPASRLTSLAHDFAGAVQDVTSSFTYNPASQIASRTRGNDLFAWVSPAPFSRPYTNNGLNQTVQAGAVTFAYDGRGNLTSSGSDTYSYTSENRMASGPNASLFTYDPLGRMTYLIEGPKLTVFQYDGNNLIREQDTAGNTFARHVFGPGSDEPILSYIRNSSGGFDKRYLHGDERGSIIAQSDAGGSVVQINTYDDYGIPKVKTANGADLPVSMLGRFGYTGQVWLPTTGIYHYKNRAYSPTLGRFFQTDPIGYGDGPNLYGYVGGDPINFSDPLGLAKEKNKNTKKDGGGGTGNGGGASDAPEIGVTGPPCAERPNCRDRFSGVVFIGGDGGGGGGDGGGGDQPNCNRSVNGKPSPRALAVRVKAAVDLSKNLAKSGNIVAGAVVYAATALTTAAGLRPRGFLDPQSPAAGNRSYGAVTASLGLSRETALRISGIVEKYGPTSNSKYDERNGSPFDPSSRSNGAGNGRFGNSIAAEQNIDEGIRCAQ